MATPDRPAAPKCGLWGCGFTATTPVTVMLPDPPVEKLLVVCDYHATMMRNAEAAS